MKRKKWMDRTFGGLVVGFYFCAMSATNYEDMLIIITGAVVVVFGLVNLILDKNLT